jgi:hypothetical protein
VCAVGKEELTDRTLIIKKLRNVFTKKRGRWGSVVGCDTKLQAGKSQVRVPMGVDFFNLPNSSSRIMALGSTHVRL